MKSVGLLLVLLTLLGAEPTDRTGPYIAAGGGYATFYDDERMQVEDINNVYNMNLMGGAFINKYLSVELGVDYYPTFTSSENDNTTHIYIIDAAAKAHYAFWKDRIDLYAAFGAGGLFWKENILGAVNKDNSSEVRGDIGVGIRMLRDLTLNIGYRRYFFILDHETGLKDENRNIEYIRYNMTLSSAYANIEVQF